jgi:hypothetical protein
MAATFMDKHGTFTQVPDFLNEMPLSPAAKAVYAVLAGFEHAMGEVYVARQKIREKLKLALTTISTAVTELEEKELLKRTGKFKYGSYPVVQLFSHPKTGVSESKHQNKQMLTEELATANTQLERQLDLKEQPEKNVCSKILEKNNLKESLKIFGIGANKAMRLIIDFPSERIESQIINLEAEKARGVVIENPAGWLIKAIQKNFRPAVEKSSSPSPAQAARDEIQAEKSRAAQRLLQEALHEERIAKPQESKHLAQKSLTMHRTREAEELINRIDAAEEKKAQQEKALAVTPKEEFERLLTEEIEKQKSFLARWSKREITDFHREAAYIAALARLAH